jgi:hypothetical protein
MATGYVDPLKKNQGQQVATSTVAPGAAIGPTIPGQQMKPQATQTVKLNQTATPAPKATATAPQAPAQATAATSTTVTNPYTAQPVVPQQVISNIANPYKVPAATVAGQTYTPTPSTAGGLAGSASGGAWNGPAQVKVTAPTTPTVPVGGATPPAPTAPPATPRPGALDLQMGLGERQNTIAKIQDLIANLGPRPADWRGGQAWDVRKKSLDQSLAMEQQRYTAIQDPTYMKIARAMEAQGWDRFADAGMVKEALDAGVTPEALIQHFAAIAGKYQNASAAAQAGHGANMIINEEVIQNLLNGIYGVTGWSNPAWDEAPAGGVTEGGGGQIPPGEGAPPRAGTTPMPTAPTPRPVPRSVAAPQTPAPTGYLNPYIPKSARAPGSEPAPAVPPSPTPTPPVRPPRGRGWGDDPRLAEIVKRGMAALFPGLG